MGADRLDEVLDAAYTCLTRYGARRTTMDDIASQMGVSRSAVYQYVRGKDEALRLLAERLHQGALGRARAAAADSGAPPAERIRGVLGAKLDLAFRVGGASPHTSELLDERDRLFGRICGAFTTSVHELLTDLFARVGTVEGVTPAQAAEMCLALTAGLEAARDGQALARPATTALVGGLLDERRAAR
ncbi:TetR/AcrR family transcriptional regulator [Streptomonospora wellingtoniae]|uniref:TetR/AcrR family transcriptional regulator n=1 Tax=Streptomonospora wellingtoniae TaxID=3075544 RepID=A0ABU2L0Y8_9ACTN|nr:TetR/AcrR family transcriptional regulator [Streptomonospora sp. DSM 45055]MDT0305172.1 TetR/AcrR family transcriptional regulator [Streptomonospora sp. DSM 45055]